MKCCHGNGENINVFERGRRESFRWSLREHSTELKQVGIGLSKWEINTFNSCFQVNCPFKTKLLQTIRK